MSETERFEYKMFSGAESGVRGEIALAHELEGVAWGGGREGGLNFAPVEDLKRIRVDERKKILVRPRRGRDR